MPNYKIGDKIKIVRKGKFDWNTLMRIHIGKTLTIVNIVTDLRAPNRKYYKVKENDWFWYEDSFEPKLKTIKEFGIVKFCKEMYK